MFWTAGLIVTALAIGQVSAELVKPDYTEDAITKDFIPPGPLRTLKEVSGLKFKNHIENGEAVEPELSESDRDAISYSDSDSNSDSDSQEDPENPEIADLLKKLIVKVKVKVKVNNKVKRKIKVKCVDRF